MIKRRVAVKVLFLEIPQTLFNTAQYDKIMNIKSILPVLFIGLLEEKTYKYLYVLALRNSENSYVSQTHINLK